MRYPAVLRRRKRNSGALRDSFLVHVPSPACFVVSWYKVGPTSYKLSLELKMAHKWPYTWLTGVITSISGVITGRGPPCIPQSTFLQFRGGDFFLRNLSCNLIHQFISSYEIKFVVISQSSFSRWWFPNVFKYFDPKDLEDV